MRRVYRRPPGDFAGDVAVIMPVSVVPSRIRMVACCLETVLFAHDARNNNAPRVALTRMVRHMRFGVHVCLLEVLNAVYSSNLRPPSHAFFVEAGFNLNLISVVSQRLVNKINLLRKRETEEIQRRFITN